MLGTAIIGDLGFINNNFKSLLDAVLNAIEHCL